MNIFPDTVAIPLNHGIPIYQLNETSGSNVQVLSSLGAFVATFLWTICQQRFRRSDDAMKRCGTSCCFGHRLQIYQLCPPLTGIYTLGMLAPQMTVSSVVTLSHLTYSIWKESKLGTKMANTKHSVHIALSWAKVLKTYCSCHKNTAQTKLLQS